MPLAGRAAYFLHSSNLSAPKQRNKKKLVVIIITKYSHYSIKILNTYNTEPSTDLIRGESRVVFADDYADHLAPFLKHWQIRKLYYNR